MFNNIARSIGDLMHPDHKELREQLANISNDIKPGRLGLTVSKETELGLVTITHYPYKKVEFAPNDYLNDPAKKDTPDMRWVIALEYKEAESGKYVRDAWHISDAGVCKYTTTDPKKVKEVIAAFEEKLHPTQTNLSDATLPAAP